MTQDEQITLDRNPDYFGGQAKIAQINFGSCRTPSCALWNCARAAPTWLSIR